MMPINTKIEGNPASLQSVAHWLRQDFSRTVDDANDKVYSARNSAAGGLRGDAADGLQNKLTTGGRQVDDFSDGASTSAQQVDAAADVLQRVQNDMQRIRSEASGAGLKVSGDEVQEPGAAPAAPGPAPTGTAATRDAVHQHNTAQQAQNDHNAKVAAYNKAKTEAEDVHRRWQQQVDQRAREWQNTKNKTIFTVAGFGVTGGVVAASVKQKSILSKHADALKERAAKLEAHARAMPTDPQGAYRNMDAAAADRKAAGSLVDDGMGKFGKVAGRVSNVGGGVLAAGGVAYDISHGKPATQAVASGAAGFGSSVAAGAAIGTVVGGPVGTAAGAVVGTAVGAFTSGAVDSMFQHGIGHVGTAVNDGFKAVGDTGEAIGSLAKDAGEGIGSGVKHVWNSIF